MPASKRIQKIMRYNAFKPSTLCAVILIPFLILALLAPIASAAGWNYKLFSKMLGGKDPDQYSLTWNSLFGQSEEDFGQDLYLQMYQNVVYRPESESIRETAQRFGLTLTEAQQVLNGSITPLLQQEKRASTFSQEEAFELALSVQNFFEETKTFKNLSAEFAASTEPTEIFANGDLSDSGFDLISDLDIIEYYLFIERTPNTMNKTLPAGEKSSSGKGVQLEIPQAPTSSYSSFSDAGSQRSVSSNLRNDWNRQNFSGRLIASTNPLLASTAGTSGSLILPSSAHDGAACKNESSLEEALDDYDKGHSPTGSDAGKPEDSGNSSLPSSEATSESTGNSPSSTISGSSGVGAGDNSFFGNNDSPETPSGNYDFPASPLKKEGNYPTDPGLCDGLNDEDTEFFKEYSTNANNKNIASFCFAIKTKTRNYSSYSPTKPCINCTIAKINESFRETLSRSLTPSKLTGNIFESAKCKEGVNISDLLDMNVYFIPMPILTPPKYSQYEGHDIGKEFDLFAKKYLPQSESRKKQGLPPTDEETAKSTEAVQQCLKYADENTTQTELLDCTNRIIASEKGKQEQALIEALDATSLEIAAEFYQPLEKELNQMISYFRIFQDAFTEVSTKACPNLNNKPSK